LKKTEEPQAVKTMLDSPLLAGVPAALIYIEKGKAVFEEANSSFLELALHTASVPGKSLTEVFAPDPDNEEFLIQLMKAEQGSVTKYLLRSVHNRNRFFEGLFSSYPGADNGKQLILLRCIEVSEWYERTQRIYQAQETLGAMIQSLQGGILVEDENRRLVLTNAEFCNLFNIPAAPEDMVGADCREAAEASKTLFADEKGFIEGIEHRLHKQKPDKGEILALRDGRILERDYIPIFILGNYRGHLWHYRDITARKRAEEQIFASEQKYRQIVEDAGDLIYRVNMKGRMSFFNPAFVKASGFSTDELTNFPFYNFIRADYRTYVREFYLKQVKKRMFSTYLEFPALNKSGKEIWIGQRVQLVYSGTKVMEIQAVARDITERVYIQAELDRTRKFFEKILNDLPGQIAVFDRGLRYIYVNPASIRDEEIRRNIIGKTDMQYIQMRGRDPEIARKRMDSLRRVLMSGEETTFTEVLDSPDGPRILQRTISPIKYEDGSIEYLIGYGLDITELRRAEAEILQSRKRLESVLQTVGDGILTISSDRLIQIANNVAEKIFLHRIDNITGRFIDELIYTESPSGEKSHRFPLESPERFEAFGRRGDGSVIPLAVQITKATAGEEEFYTVSFSDISIYRETVKALTEAKTAAEESIRTKENFLAHMSHELRTPMNAVVGLTNLLIRTNPNEEQRRILQVIRGATDNLLVIINDILDFSKLEAGKIILDEREFSLAAVTEQCIKTSEYFAREKGIDLSFSIESGLPDLLIGDAVRLNQILLNLLSNAIKFTKKGSVRLAVAYISENGGKITVRFTVTDTGVGIPADMLDRIFESFEQVKGVNKSHTAGTGLGLAIVKRLTELMEGSVAVVSAPGKGSEFSVTIPFARHEGSIKSEPTASLQKGSASLSGIKVLVAEDNPVNQMVISSYLKMWGAEFTVTSDGAEASREFERGSFDIVFMDISMPGVDGYEGTRLIRKKIQEKGTSVPIIALTAYTAPEYESDPESNLFDGFVGKPFQPEELLRVVQKLTGKGIAPGSAPAAQPPPADTSPERSYNLDYLKKITNNDEFLAYELMRIASGNLMQSAGQLQDLKRGNDIRALKELIHKIKPVFGYFSVDSSIRLCGEISEGLKGGYIDAEVKQKISELTEEMKQLRLFINKQLESD